MSSFDERTQATRAKAVAFKIKELYEFYLENNLFVPPTELCEDKKSYLGIVIRYFDPPFTPLADNLVLIEQYVGDSWTLRFEKRQR